MVYYWHFIHKSMKLDVQVKFPHFSLIPPKEREREREIQHNTPKQPLKENYIFPKNRNNASK